MPQMETRDASGGGGPRLRVAIAGGGIGGMALALALKRVPGNWGRLWSTFAAFAPDTPSLAGHGLSFRVTLIDFASGVLCAKF